MASGVSGGFEGAGWREREDCWDILSVCNGSRPANQTPVKVSPVPLRSRQSHPRGRAK